MLNWGHYHRRIPLDNRSRPGVDAKFWMGIPRGRWDGDTLVVESTNFNGKMWLDSVGNFVSPNVRITERFRLVEANTLDYEVTIDDPQVFTQVWTLSYRLRRQGGGGGGGGGRAIRTPTSHGNTRATRETRTTLRAHSTSASSGSRRSYRRAVVKTYCGAPA